MRSAVIVGVAKHFLDAVAIEHDLGNPAPCRLWRQASVAERHAAPATGNSSPIRVFSQGQARAFGGTVDGGMSSHREFPQ